MNKVKLFVVIFQLAIVGLSDANTIVSANSGSWSAGATWVGGIVPLPGDDVVILAPHIVDLNDPRSCVTMTINPNATLTLSSALTNSGAVVNDGILSWTSGSFNGAGVITNNGTLNLTSFLGHNTASNITNNGTMNWNSGSLDASGGSQVLTNTGTLNFNGPGTSCLMSIVNSGTLQRTVGGSFTLTNPLDNQSGGTVLINNGCEMTVSTGIITQSGTFTNNGTLNFSGGTHTINAPGSFSGSGTININGSTILNGASWAPAMPNLNQTSTLSGAVALTIPSGTNWNWTSGDFGLSNTITNNGILNILGVGAHNTAANITNNGTINWTQGNIDSGGGGQILTNAGTLNFNGVGYNCNMSIVNSGTLQRTVAGSFTLTNPLDNQSAGTVIISTGSDMTIQTGGNITQSGTFTNNGTLSFSGGTHTINVAGSFSGSGTININGSTIMNGASWAPAIPNVTQTSTLSGAVTLNIPLGTTWNWPNGDFGLSNTITNNGTLNILSFGSHNTASNITNNGTINWTQGNIDNGAGGQILTNTGTFNFNGVAYNCNMSIVNSGTLQRTVAGSFTLNNPFDNQLGGTVLIAPGCSMQIDPGGNITQNGTFTNNGTISFSGGTHTINVPGSFSGSGIININGSTIMNGASWAPAIPNVTQTSTLSGAVTLNIPLGTIWNWPNGDFGLSNTITNNGTLNILSVGSHNTASNITNNGTINWTQGNIDNEGGGQILTNTGTLNFNGVAYNCNMSIVNSGTLQRTVAGSFTLTNPLDNQSAGTVIISTGSDITIQTGGNITQSGTYTNNGTLSFSGGTHTINAPGSFSGSGTININGSTIMNGASWAPAISNVTQTSTLSGAVALTIPLGTTWDWSIGDFGLSNTITNNGILNILGFGSHNTASNITNNGTINWTQATIDQAGGGQILTNTGTFNFNATGYNCNMPIVNSGTFQKTSTGTSDITTTYTGNIGSFVSLQNGIMKFNSSFNNSGTIKGIAAINLSSATISSFGGVSPGNSPGTLTLTGNYTNSALSIEIDYSGGMVTKDSLYVSGNITLGGSLVVTQTGNVPSGNYVFLKSGGTMTGTFSSVTLPDCYTIEYGATTVTLKKGIAKVWDGTVNQWDEPTHWNPNGVPCPYDDVIINSGICELNINPDLKSLTINGGTLKKVDAATYAINVPIVVATPGFINAFAGSLDINNTLDNNGTIQGFADIDIAGATMIGGYGKWAPGNSTGTLGTTGTYDNEVIEMEIQGPGTGGGMVEVDFLSVSQTMLVDDALVVKWLGGTIPPGIRTIMQCAGGGSCRTGEFGSVTFPPQCPTGKCKILYNGTQVQLENTEPIEFQGTCTWLGGTGNWSTVNKWSCNDVPNANDDVVINSGVVTLDIPTTVKTLNITGGSVIGSNNLSVTNSFLWTGGSFSAGTDFSIGAATLSGNISLSNTSMILSQGGTFNNPTLTLSSNASIILPATKTLTLNNQGTINNDNALNFVNNGTIIKNGSGVFTFKNPFVNNGITNITAGTIKYDNNFTSTGLLKGNGFIDFTAAGNVQIGPVNPGSSPGTFHVTGNYTNKHYLAEMLHSANVTTHDRIDVTAIIQLQDSITIIKLAGEDIPYGTYTLMHCDGSASCVTGNFNIVKYPAFCGGADCSLMISGQDVKFVYQASLPVELSAFDARKLGSSVRLDWTTASEVNVKEFIIERSSNATSWADLGSIDARGNSTESIKYFYFDNAPVDGNNFYRLRIIDQDGSFKYSPIVNVVFESAGNMQLFPNPVNQILTIRPPSNAEGNLWIVNSSGQTVIRQSLIPGESVQINVAALPSGLYAVCFPGHNCKTFVKE